MNLLKLWKMADTSDGWFAGALKQFGGPLIAKGIDFLSGNAGVRKQYHANKKLAKLQHALDMDTLRFQMDYNSPSAQMQRFKEAGLNPNLVYGQGTPGNIESAPRMPNIQAPDIQSIYSGLGSDIMQMKLMSAQTDLVKAKTDESTVKQDLGRAQTALVKANPYMRREYVDSMVLQLTSAAQLKEQEASFMRSKTMDDGVRWERGFLKMQRELDLLELKFDLGSSDKRLKAEVLQSKEFQNALQKIQLNWMRDGEITPQHIYTFLQMLLSRMM